MTEEPRIVLAVEDLCVDIASARGAVRLVEGVSFAARANEVLCIVGESGSGKSITMLAAMRLLPSAARITQGHVRLDGQDLATVRPIAMRALRGKAMAMIFQDPMTALNPVIRIGDQIAEMIALHEPGISRVALKQRVVALLDQVNIPNPSARYGAYPHELSGGMRQRVMIAMAIAHRPAVLIADEPTTALDVTIQAQVLELLRRLRAETGSALILITHDLGVVAETADRVVVMYAGRVMEASGVADLFRRPRHPYTVGLLASLLDGVPEDQPAYSIPGQAPSADARPAGCAFHPRCGLCRGRTLCGEERPAMQDIGPDHAVACHFPDEVQGWIDADFPALEAAR